MLLDRERDRRSSPRPGAERIAPGARSLVCARCGHHVSDDSERIERSGAHEHTFVNPAGVVFLVGCFARAPGCTHIGATQSAFSWFPGWTWQIATCARCHAHLGWLYRNGASQFHGLIATALRPGE